MYKASISDDTYDSLEDFTFNLDGEGDVVHTFTLKKDQYLKSIFGNDYLLTLVGEDFSPVPYKGASSNQAWILGLMYLKDFYTIFDMDDGDGYRIGFVDRNPDAGITNWGKVLSIVGLILAFFTGVVCCCCCFVEPCKKFRREKIMMSKKAKTEKKLRDSM